MERARELVAAHCNSCHPFHARVGAGYTAKGWRTVMRMNDQLWWSLPPDQLATMTAYLTQHSLKRGNPPYGDPRGREGLDQEWQVPTPVRGRTIRWRGGWSPLVHGPDGQCGSAGFDPKTAFQEYSLKTPHCGPHGLVEDKDGNIGTPETPRP